eukprot:CAMPEP_0178931190 /NCGR_PEP_ID=MMETSP0786-20121207/21758_1 /TAXON_ID=186022 /ORGANISM="Thalassionema frauenfeldii, Strain CCMP 1798" /LENGTH=184 /DNA_ID=CAMNT_0020608011 /DNA_START=145 /DNA_END=699 /DNA_ORIENTATION=+
MARLTSLILTLIIALQDENMHGAIASSSNHDAIQRRRADVSVNVTSIGNTLTITGDKNNSGGDSLIIEQNNDGNINQQIVIGNSEGDVDVDTEAIGNEIVIGGPATSPSDAGLTTTPTTAGMSPLQNLEKPSLRPTANLEHGERKDYTMLAAIVGGIFAIVAAIIGGIVTRQKAISNNNVETTE